MIPLSLDEVEALCDGALARAPGATHVTGVRIDSRRITSGDLFVAVGDGAAFTRDASDRGAAATLVPDDAFAALAAIASAVRDRTEADVVGITGSTGKTSTKDILAAICASRARTVAAEASYNNELGVPLTLCRIEPDTDVCIVEIAMRGLGQIAEMAAVARPRVAVVTNVGPAHIELVGSLEGVVRAKGELIDALPPGGVAIVPADFPITRDDLDVIRLEEPDAAFDGREMRIRFGGDEISFNFRARHQAVNALAALYAARALGLSATGHVDVVFSPWRGEELTLAGGGILINDAYNANPASMRAALDDLVDRAEGRRTVAVLGDMAELGPDAPRYHVELGVAAAEAGVGALVAVGDLARHYLEGAGAIPVASWVATAEEAIPEAQRIVEPGDCVLVKASRAVGLEVVAGALAGAAV